MKSQLNKLIKEYHSLQPIEDDIKKTIDKKFRLEFNYNSNHLEGNTLTYGETKLLLLFDQTKGNHELRELEEMKAHDVALMMIKEEAVDKKKPLTEKFIKDLNHTLLVRPFWKEAITADGQSTRRQIKVGEYKEFPNSVIQANGEIFEYASPQETPILMGELVKWYNDEEQKNELTAIELAALLHYRYIRIHPFDDGNGRVARLLVNYVLYRNDLPPVIIKTDDKKNYLRALQQADAGDLQAFIDYMIQQLAWSVDICIRAARGENIEDQDDWEKQLSLLKKGLGDKSNSVVKKSEESVRAVFENVIIPFSEIYEEKLSQFDSLFMDKTVVLNDLVKPRYYINMESLINACFKTIDENKNNSMLSVLIRKFDFHTLFKIIRQPYKDIRIESLHITITFERNAYSISYGEKTISKLYNDFFTEDEMNNIISEIATDLMQKIEEAINKREN